MVSRDSKRNKKKQSQEPHAFKNRKHGPPDSKAWPTRPVMIFPLPLRTSHALLATTVRLYWHAPELAWSARVRSDDLLFRGAPRQHGARAQRVRETQQLSGASHMAWRVWPHSQTQLKWSPSDILFNTRQLCGWRGFFRGSHCWWRRFAKSRYSSCGKAASVMKAERSRLLEDPGVVLRFEKRRRNPETHPHKSRVGHPPCCFGLWPDESFLVRSRGGLKIRYPSFRATPCPVTKSLFREIQSRSNGQSCHLTRQKNSPTPTGLNARAGDMHVPTNDSVWSTLNKVEDRVKDKDCPKSD